MSIKINILINDEKQKYIDKYINIIKESKAFSLKGISFKNEEGELIINFSGEFDSNSYYILSLLSKTITFNFGKTQHNTLLSKQTSYYYVDNVKCFVIPELDYITNYEKFSEEYFYSFKTKKTFQTKEHIEYLEKEEQNNIDYYLFDYCPEETNMVAFLKEQNREEISFIRNVLSFIRVLKYPKLLEESKTLFYSMENIDQ
jgi:hypothetical protein